MTLTQAQRNAVLRIVLQALKRLEREAADGVKRLSGKMGTHHEVGEQAQGLVDARADGGSADNNVNSGWRHRALHARTIELIAERPAVPAARPALRKFREQGRPSIARLAFGVGCVARGQKPTHGRGAHAGHFLHQKRHTAVKHADTDRVWAERGVHWHLADANTARAHAIAVQTAPMEQPAQPHLLRPGGDVWGKLSMRARR
jgi:hypothetical protein